MTRITVECPRCCRENSTVLRGDGVARGTMFCECGELIEWQLHCADGDSPQLSGDRTGELSND